MELTYVIYFLYCYLVISLYPYFSQGIKEMAYDGYETIRTIMYIISGVWRIIFRSRS